MLKVTELVYGPEPGSDAKVPQQGTVFLYFQMMLFQCDDISFDAGDRKVIQMMLNYCGPCIVASTLSNDFFC